MNRAAPGRRRRGGRGGREPRARIQMRELRAMELALQGWSQHEIARELGVSQAAVSKILRRVEAHAMADLAAEVHQHRARQTVRLEHQYRESMRAWERSKADLTRKRQRKSQPNGAPGGASVAEITVENQQGDPRYLEAGRKALADLRKLWGIDAPHKVDLQTARNPYEGMSEADLRQVLAQQAHLLAVGDLDAEHAPKAQEVVDGGQ